MGTIQNLEQFPCNELLRNSTEGSIEESSLNLRLLRDELFPSIDRTCSRAVRTCS